MTEHYVVQTAGSPQPSRTVLLIWMIVAEVLTVLSLMIWLLVAGFSVMAFDSGPSTAAWVFVGVIWAYPILPLGLSAGAWFAYGTRHNTTAAILITLAFLPPVLLLLLLWVTSASWS